MCAYVHVEFDAGYVSIKAEDEFGCVVFLERVSVSYDVYLVRIEIITED